MQNSLFLYHFCHLLNSLAPPGPNFPKGLKPDSELQEPPLQMCICSFSPEASRDLQNHRFVQKLRYFVLQVPKICKKKWSETLDINSQNEALIMLFQIMGHLALYVWLKKGPIYSLPHLVMIQSVANWPIGTLLPFGIPQIFQIFC